MSFPGNTASIPCSLYQLSRFPAATLPGGYDLRAMVFFTGADETLPSGIKLTFGQQGKVTGSTDNGKGVTVLFPGNSGSVNCCLTEVARKLSSEELFALETASAVLAAANSAAAVKIQKTVRGHLSRARHSRRQLSVTYSTHSSSSSRL